MKHLIKFSLGIILFGSIALFESKAQEQMPISFGDMPRWIEEHIEFPKENAGYGTEHECIIRTCPI